MTHKQNYVGFFTGLRTVIRAVITKISREILNREKDVLTFLDTEMTSEGFHSVGLLDRLSTTPF